MREFAIRIKFKKGNEFDTFNIHERFILTLKKHKIIIKNKLKNDIEIILQLKVKEK